MTNCNGVCQSWDHGITVMPIGVRSEQPEQRYVWVYNQAAGGSWVKVDAEVSVYRAASIRARVSIPLFGSEFEAKMARCICCRTHQVNLKHRLLLRVALSTKMPS